MTVAFWKKSDDPWDRKPGTKPTVVRETGEPKKKTLDALKKWNEDRKAAAREAEYARRLPPEKCPWCGKEMEQGYMVGGRDTTHWYPGVLTTKAAWLGGPREERLDLLDEGHFINYKTVWLCRECKKMTFDMPKPPEMFDPFADQTAGETTEEREEGET